MNKNNYYTIENFLFDKDQKFLFLHILNDEVEIFYQYVINFLSKKKLRLKFSDEIILNNNTLFGLEEINLYKANTNNKIDKIINLSGKSIIFTDYKTIKKYKKSYSTINSYEYYKDINFFIKEILKIKNDYLINNCLNNPQLIYSEMSKYYVNSNNYSPLNWQNEKENNIVLIRKKLRDPNISIKDSYFFIKEESKYKKLSFLIY